MSRKGSLLCRVALSMLCLTVLWGASAQAQCTYPMTVTFGLNDNFAANPTDPSYNPALPEFVTYLNGLGIPTAKMTTYDAQAPDLWMVASLRHGLAYCFAGASNLTLCFHAQAHAVGDSTNDDFAIHDTDFGVYSFPVVYGAQIAPTLIPAWNSGTTATFCIDLTSQMIGGQIGDMLQFRVQDDTLVDYIQMTLQ